MPTYESIAEGMTKDEASQLLYLETRAVDYGGVVDAVKMNQVDHAVSLRWDAEGFIGFGRITLGSQPQPQREMNSPIYWVELSADAWAVAALLRKARAERMLARRKWVKTSEA